MKGIFIKGARIVDPYRHLDIPSGDVAIMNGRVVQADDLKRVDYDVVSARGLWVVPRLVDMHVHFREPGQTWKETIATGSRAAARGGISAVATMPNTTPVIDTPELIQWVRSEAEKIGLTRVFPLGAVTVQSQGDELADLYRMQQAGAFGFSDDGRPLVSSLLMRATLSYSTTCHLPIINHAEDPGLSRGAACHEGEVSAQMGIPGAPEAAESVMVWRDVLLAGLTGGYLHVPHISATESLLAIEYAKRRKFHVTSEVAPHHLLLSDQALREFGYDAVTKVNPPLRPEATRQALLKAVQEGLIDVLASDHAPHHRDEKAMPYTVAPFGISGLETILGVLLTTFVHSGGLSPLEAFQLMTTGPDKVLGLGYGGFQPGEVADLTLIDPKRDWVVDPSQFASKGQNTPMAGMTLKGQAVATMVNGVWVMQEGEVLNAGLSTFS